MKRIFVTHYQTVQHYGGREEGGWWYHRTYATKMRAFQRRNKALRYMRRVAQLDGLGERDEETGAWPIGIPAGQICGSKKNSFEEFKTGKLLDFYGRMRGWWLVAEKYDQGQWIRISTVPRDCDETGQRKPHYE